jgi:hypothetical protein
MLRLQMPRTKVQRNLYVDKDKCTNSRGCEAARKPSSRCLWHSLQSVLFLCDRLQPVHQLHCIEPSVTAPYDGPSFFVVCQVAKHYAELVPGELQTSAPQPRSVRGAVARARNTPTFVSVFLESLPALPSAAFSRGALAVNQRASTPEGILVPDHRDRWLRFKTFV